MPDSASGSALAHAPSGTPEHPHVVRRGEGVPLIALHGQGVDHRALLPLDEALAAGGVFQRVYVDLPGFGGTAALPEPGGLPQLADWLVDWARREAQGRPVAVVGHSMGGLLARHLVAALRDQTVGVALLAPVVDPDEERRDLPELTVRERDAGLVAALDGDDDAEPFLTMSPRLVRPVWDRFRAAAVPGARLADTDALKRLSADYTLPRVPEQTLPALERPALIVTGREDAVVGFRDQLRLLEPYPRATYAALDAAGHHVHLDQPDAVASLVRAWAERVAAETAGA